MKYEVLDKRGVRYLNGMGENCIWPKGSFINQAHVEKKHIKKGALDAMVASKRVKLIATKEEIKVMEQERESVKISNDFIVAKREVDVANKRVRFAKTIGIREAAQKTLDKAVKDFEEKKKKAENIDSSDQENVLIASIEKLKKEIKIDEDLNLSTNLYLEKAEKPEDKKKLEKVVKETDARIKKNQDSLIKLEESLEKLKG